ncbi:MAG TPA: rhomboid family intramembrane serine protease [Myxococcaceae bacterium]|nr:rhomboid family intramembrane serine protease [Myxococcaceae bacterium]
MIPISDDNPTLRTPVMTYFLLGAIGAVWFLVEGAGLSAEALARAVCNWGMVPGELTGGAALGEAVPLSRSLACVVDREPVNVLTPVTSMFLHGGWGHLLGNAVFFWVFGNNVEDSMGRFRFLVFYLVCGLAAALTHVMVDPTSPIPTVGASGAISGVMGAYLVLYPRVRVNMLFIIFIIIRIIPLPAWVVLLWWFGVQLLSGLPQLTMAGSEASSGVAFWAHIGGFVAGVVLIKLFESRSRVAQRDAIRHRLHPDHP